MRLRQCILFGVMACQAMIVHASEYPAFNPDVSTWTESSMPADEDSLEWHNWRYSAGQAGIAWSVELLDGKVIAQLSSTPIRLSDPLPPFDIKIPAPYEKVSKVLATDGGWFVAFNDKKRGSQLWWYDSSGKENYKVAKAYVTDFIVKDNDIYILDAFYFRVSPPEGSLQKVSKDGDGKWHVKKIVAMPGLPLTGRALPNGDFVIAEAPSGLLRVNGNYEVVEILGMDDWYIGFPNSMVGPCEDKYIYIGAIQYVVEVNLETLKVRYLVPSKEFIEHKIDEVSRSRFIKSN